MKLPPVRWTSKSVKPRLLRGKLMEVKMTSLIIAVWGLLIVATVGVVVMLVFIFKMKKSTEKMLNETENLIKKVEEQIDNLGKNLNETTENTKDATFHLKNALKNMEKISKFINLATPFATVLLVMQGFIKKTDSKQSNILGKMINVGKFLVAVQQGFLVAKKISSNKKGGIANYGRK